MDPDEDGLAARRAGPAQRELTFSTTAPTHRSTHSHGIADPPRSECPHGDADLGPDTPRPPLLAASQGNMQTLATATP